MSCTDACPVPEIITHPRTGRQKRDGFELGKQAAVGGVGHLAVLNRALRNPTVNARSSRLCSQRRCEVYLLPCRSIATGSDRERIPSTRRSVGECRKSDARSVNDHLDSACIRESARGPQEPRPVLPQLALRTGRAIALRGARRRCCPCLGRLNSTAVRETRHSKARASPPRF